MDLFDVWDIIIRIKNRGLLPYPKYFESLKFDDNYGVALRNRCQVELTDFGFLLGIQNARAHFAPSL